MYTEGCTRMQYVTLLRSGPPVFEFMYVRPHLLGLQHKKKKKIHALGRSGGICPALILDQCLSVGLCHIVPFTFGPSMS